MRVAVLGAGGMLGTDLSAFLRTQDVDLSAFQRTDLDITDRSALFSALVDFDIVVNCAAYTDVDGAEVHRDECDAVNEVGVRNVAMACALNGGHLIHISTDYVFGKLDNPKLHVPWKESDATHPLNHYGYSKLKGELAIRETLSRHTIVRTSRLFSFHGSNFVTAVIGRSMAGETLRMVDDQWSCPTSTLDLVTGLWDLMQRPLVPCGTFHMVNQGSATPFRLAEQAVYEASRHVSCPGPVIAVTSFKAAASRPSWSVLCPSHRLGRLRRHWCSALRAAVERISFDSSEA